MSARTRAREGNALSLMLEPGWSSDGATATSRIGLRFPAALEQEYLQDYVRRHRRVLRLSVSMAIVVYFAYIGLDHLMFDRYRGNLAIPAILGVGAPTALLGILSTWHPDARTVRGTVMLACACNGIALIFAYAKGLSQGQSIPYECIIIYMYYIYFLLGITHIIALVMATATMAAHIGSAWIAGLPPADLYDHTYMMSAVIVVGAMSSRIIEISDRRIWISEKRLQELAEFDTLTGLYNQRTFFERADASLAAARGTSREFALAIIGLEYLPAYNHMLGHVGADDCMRRIAELIRAMAHGRHLSGRLDGEQFVILLEDSGAEASRQFLDRLRLAVAKERILHPGSPQGFATIRAALVTGPADSFASSRSATQAAGDKLGPRQNDLHNVASVMH